MPYRRFRPRTFRRFKRGAGKASTFRRFVRAGKSVARYGLGRLAHAATKHFFSWSGICKQPIEDSFVTDLFISIRGNYVSGVQSGNFLFALNDIVHPFNKGGATIAVPSQTIASWDPTGVQNLLYNSTTSTGIWQYFLVLACKPTVEVGVATTDRPIVAMAPVTGANSYGNVDSAAIGPGAVNRLCVSGVRNVLSSTFVCAQIAGMNDSQFMAQQGTFAGQYGAAPTYTQFVQVRFGTSENTVNAVSFVVKIHYRVRFFQRVDTALLEV